MPRAYVTLIEEQIGDLAVGQIHLEKRRQMFSTAKWMSVKAGYGMLLVGLTAPSARAQVAMPLGARTGAPMLQAASLQRATGQVMPITAPFQGGFNPYMRSGLFTGISPYGTLQNAYGSIYGQAFGNPYGGGITGYLSSYGGMNGSYYDSNYGYMDPGAALTRAQGDLMVNQQQAYLLREQVRAQRATNARDESSRSVNNNAYASSATAARERSSGQETARLSKDPVRAEIWSGTALNQILADLQRRPVNDGTENLTNPSLLLDASLLKQINLTFGKGHIGLLKYGGRLSWPAGFEPSAYAESKERLNALAFEVFEQARVNGRLDSNTLREMSRAVEDLRRRFRKNGGELSPEAHIEANRFLQDLDAALTALKRPDVGALFTSHNDLRARTVPELVQFMTERRLQFAPAHPRERMAYEQIHQGLTSFGKMASH
jgi:hypothetical protein